MPSLTGTIQADGAIIRMLVGWSAANIATLRKTLRPVPPGQQVEAIIDTGAEATCLDPALIRQLSLPFTGIVPTNMPAGPGLGWSTQHEAGLTILHPSGNVRDNLLVPDLLVCELPLRSLGYDAVIGRDVLARCRFLFDGLAGTYALDY